MYPSGAWHGYWDQPEFGRQPMENLTLRFAGGQISGTGVDLLAEFVFRGTYDDTGRITLVKQYVGARTHQVLYDGLHDGEGTIHGRWSIPPVFSGAFALRPAAHRSDAPLPPAQEIVPRTPRGA